MNKYAYQLHTSTQKHSFLFLGGASIYIYIYTYKIILQVHRETQAFMQQKSKIIPIYIYIYTIHIYILYTYGSRPSQHQAGPIQDRLTRRKARLWRSKRRSFGRRRSTRPMQRPYLVCKSCGRSWIWQDRLVRDHTLTCRQCGTAWQGQGLQDLKAGRKKTHWAAVEFQPHRSQMAGPDLQAGSLGTTTRTSRRPQTQEI